MATEDVARALDSYPVRSLESYISTYTDSLDRARRKLAETLLIESGQMSMLINKGGVELVAFPIEE